MRLVCASLVLTTSVIVQIPSRAAGPRIAPVPENQRSSEQQSVAAKFASTEMPNAVATYLNHSALAEHILPYEHYVWSDSTLPPRHRAILGLRTAWLTRSDYLWAHRAGAARQAGLTDDALRRIAQGPDATGWDGFEATLLRAADELHVDSFVSDPTWRALAARYDTNQLIDLVDSVGAVTMHAGAINSLGVEIESDVPDRPPSGIPYAVAARRTNVRLIGKTARIPPPGPSNGRRSFASGLIPTGPDAAPPMSSSAFVRNPPADRLRGPINRTSSTRRRCRRDSGVAIDAHRSPLPLGVRMGRTLTLGPADMHERCDVARIVAGPDSGGGDPVETALLRATDELYRDDRVSDASWGALAKGLDTAQLPDVLIAVGGHRATSMAINSAGVQLDANMADFRFPPSLR